jgi:predicted GNAT family acetyltransferase
MKFKQYKDIHKFYNATFDILMRNEAQNVIPLGNIIIGHEGKDKTEWRDPANWFMATVENEEGIQLIALMTPPKGLTLYATDNKINKDAINCLLNKLGKTLVPGIMSTNDLAYYFANAYCAENNLHHEVKDNMRLYELSQVNRNLSQIGTLRLAEERDMSFLPYWVEAFKICINKQGITMDEPQDGEIFRHYISLKNRYILEVDGVPVSLAAITRKMQTVCNIACVYTPPYFRGKGYASSCVAQVSQIILDRGFAKSIITTDLSNPTSNSIYQKIGYTPVCDSVMLEFNHPKE